MMKRKVVYLLSATMTLFLFLSVISVNAQVTIGANNAPHPGAVLDLQSEKGLLLSKVKLERANNFQLSSTGANDAIGMMVYNLNETMTDGQGKGLYIWDGTKWMCVCPENKSAPVTPQKVTGITISGPSSVITEKTISFSDGVLPDNADDKTVTWSVSGDAATINPTTGVLTGVKAGTVIVMATANDGSGIQSNPIEVTIVAAPVIPQKVTGITISGPSAVVAEKTITFSASVFPDNADNKTVTWSVSGDAATINQTTGVLTGVKAGNVTVKATANDGSGIQSNTIGVTVSALEGPTTAGTYAVYCYPNHVGCWMIENSKENESTAFSTTWKGKTKGERGYYYTWNYVNDNLCPSGYHIPSDSEWATLLTYLSSAPGSQKEKWTTDGAALAGAVVVSGNQSITWDSNGYWWTTGGKSIVNNRTTLVSSTPSEARAYSVRCVKNN